MAKVLKRSDLSKKDYKVESGVLLVKDSVYNITSDIGDGSRADFNELNPLLYWSAPVNPKINAVANVLFSDGIGYYTFNGSVWLLNFFYPSSSYIPSGPKRYKSLLTQTSTNAPIVNALENNVGNIIWTYINIGTFHGTLVGAFPENKTDIQSPKNGIISLLSGPSIGNAWSLVRSTNDLVILTTYDDKGLSNGILFNSLITIEVYP